MRRLRWLLMALTGAATACAHVPTPVVTFGHCVGAKAEETSRGILGRVMTALAQGDYVAELAKLGAELGGDVVGCAVDLAIGQLRDQVFASHDAGTAQLLARAQAWRGANP